MFLTFFLIIELQWDQERFSVLERGRIYEKKKKNLDKLEYFNLPAIIFFLRVVIPKV